MKIADLIKKRSSAPANAKTAFFAKNEPESVTINPDFSSFSGISFSNPIKAKTPLPPFCRVDCPDRIGEPCQNLLKGTWQVVRYPPERIEAEGTVYRCKKHWHELEATE